MDLQAQLAQISLSTLLVLLLFAFIPPIVYVILIRNIEAYEREPWGKVFKMFAWGAVFAVIIAVILSLILIETGRLLEDEISRLGEILRQDPNYSLLILVVLVAPLAEELAKGIGVYSLRREINEIEDGMVYGASAGLGFAATENLLYGAVAYVAEGLASSLTLIAIRSFSSALLHASSSSTFGYGIGRSVVTMGKKSAAPFYFLAVLMHGTFNLFATVGEIFQAQYGETVALLGFAAAVLFALAAISIVRSRIRRRDRAMRPYYR